MDGLGAVSLGPGYAHNATPQGQQQQQQLGAGGADDEATRPSAALPASVSAGVGDADGIGEGGVEGVRFDEEAADLDDDLDL